MQKRFILKNLPEKLQKKVNKAIEQDDFSDLLDYLEEKYPGTNIESLDLALLKAYTLIDSALQIHIDDILEMADEAILILQVFENEPKAQSMMKDIYKIRKKEEKIRHQEMSWAEQDTQTLSTEQKKNAAYQLSKIPKFYGKSAELFLSVYQDTHNLYYYCTYARMLFKSGQIEKAFIEYKNILSFDKKVKLENHSMFIGFIYEDFLTYYGDNQLKFRELWDEAIQNQFIKNMKNEKLFFPLSNIGTETIFEHALNFQFYDICEYIINKTEKDKSKKSKKLQKLVDIFLEREL